MVRCHLYSGCDGTLHSRVSVTHRITFAFRDYFDIAVAKKDTREECFPAT
jgi:hypothetical protein